MPPTMHQREDQKRRDRPASATRRGGSPLRCGLPQSGFGANGIGHAAAPRQAGIWRHSLRQNKAQRPVILPRSALAALPRYVVELEDNCMPPRLKKLIGTVLLVALVVVYALAATTIASYRLANASAWTHLGVLRHWRRFLDRAGHVADCLDGAQAEAQRAAAPGASTVSSSLSDMQRAQLTVENAIGAAEITAWLNRPASASRRCRWPKRRGFGPRLRRMTALAPPSRGTGRSAGRGKSTRRFTAASFSRTARPFCSLPVEVVRENACRIARYVGGSHANANFPLLRKDRAGAVTAELANAVLKALFLAVPKPGRHRPRPPAAGNRGRRQSIRRPALAAKPQPCSCPLRLSPALNI